MAPTNLKANRSDSDVVYWTPTNSSQVSYDVFYQVIGNSTMLLEGSTNESLIIITHFNLLYHYQITVVAIENNRLPSDPIPIDLPQCKQ